MTDLASIDVFDPGDGVVIARITGDLDLSNLQTVHAALVDAMPNDAHALVADLSAVNFLDSSGVETLFRLQRSLAVRQQRFAVAIPADAPTRRALELSGAGDDLVLAPSVDDALAVVRAEPEEEGAA
jgi:anti-sigma B factor antagonist